ncbi:MAG: nucleotide sugar dehydrogenase [Candidatus Micrarchaeota archaeon]
MGETDGTVCVVGLGYVGLHIAVACSKRGFEVIGYDISQERIDALMEGRDVSGELSRQELNDIGIDFTTNPKGIGLADYVIMALPTTLTKKNDPDLGPLKEASAVVGKNLKEGALVIVESSVYPGVTEGVVLPIIERESGLKCPGGFKIAYSPERVNPGDRKHVFEGIVKVVGGIDEESCEMASRLYSRIIDAGTFKAKDIKTAEAAKIIENIQRDINIALMNEFSLIFRKMGISTRDVVAAAETKWNFMPFKPGLVGGHCVPVNPFYLTYAARKAGYEPKVMLSGRETNDSMPSEIVNLVRESLSEIRGSRILLMGLTFKENIQDPCASPVKKIIESLRELGAEVVALEPNLTEKQVMDGFGVPKAESIGDVGTVDCVVLCTAHDAFGTISEKQISDSCGKPVLVDVRGFYDGKKAEDAGITYICL